MPARSEVRLVIDEFADSPDALFVVAGETQDHLRLTTTLSDDDIPEHEALPESVVPLSSSAGQPAEADPPLALADMPVPRSVTRLGRQSTAFVLSGGGSLGAVQVGMLRALLENDIRPDFVVGTSIGALNGAFLVGQLDLDRIAEMEKLWCTIHRRDVFRISPRHLVRGTLGSQNHLFRQRGLRSLIVRADLGFSRLEDAPLPIHVVATDLLSGDAVVLSEGDTIEALVASAAIPGVFSPVEVGGRTLIDGGVVANLPVRQALELGATKVFVLPAIFGGPGSIPSSALDMMQRSTMIATATLARRELEWATQSGEVHVLPLPSYEASSMFDFEQTSALIGSAYASSTAWLRDRARHMHLQGRRSAPESARRAVSHRDRSIVHHPTSDGTRDARSQLPQTVA
jgi:NTE family protein